MQQSLLPFKALAEQSLACPALSEFTANTACGCVLCRHRLLAASAAVGSGSEAAKKLFAKSAAAYEAALRHPTRLGGFKDRSEIRYNYACAACLSGDVHVSPAAAHLYIQPCNLHPGIVFSATATCSARSCHLQPQQRDWMHACCCTQTRCARIGRAHEGTGIQSCKRFFHC